MTTARYRARPGDYHYRLLKIVYQILKVKSLIQGGVISRSAIDHFRDMLSLFEERVKEWKVNDLSDRCGNSRRLSCAAHDTYMPRIHIYQQLDGLLPGVRRDKADEMLSLIKKVRAFAIGEFVKANFANMLESFEIEAELFSFKVEGSASVLEVFEFFSFCKQLHAKIKQDAVQIELPFGPDYASYHI